MEMGLFKAVKSNNVEDVRKILEAGADVNGKSFIAQAPLHVAAEEGHKEIAELLTAKGADHDPSDKWGWTPLHEAAGTNSKETKEIVEHLIANGADVNARCHLDQIRLGVSSNIPTCHALLKPWPDRYDWNLQAR